jgi:hypothetical protein
MSLETITQPASVSRWKMSSVSGKAVLLLWSDASPHPMLDATPGEETRAEKID